MEQLTLTLRPGTSPVHLFRGGVGEPVLYLHHLAGLQGWEPAIAELATKFEVIAPYHPGWGPSCGLDDVESGLDLVLHYIDLLDHLGLERVHVLGHSIGAWIAAELAAIHPERVNRLVLAAPIGIWDDAIRGEDPFAQNPMRATEVLFADPARRENLILRDGTVDPLEVYIQEMKDLKAAARFLWPIPDTGVARRLPRIRARTLIVVGSGDRIVPPAYAQLWRARIPRSETKTILDAGHLMNLEQPSRFATIAGSWFLQPN
ncbi:alpha/beta hydrolase [Tepidiforma sp.]|uniref:alpha/beta fold hydrolase n=1 Tax=Tepidiforma sp. TaxID=2682230 RepID=UPI002ADE52AC|nr:alpha/beta hydrolase [Tepidiforma sp.]